jgi:hypothetical protein
VSGWSNDDTTPGGPQAGASARDRALAAAAAAAAPADDPTAAYWAEMRRRDEALKTHKKEYARRATEMVEDILGHDIKLKPGDWRVQDYAAGNTDSGDGVPERHAWVTIDGVTLDAFQIGWGENEPEGVRIPATQVALTLESFGQALAQHKQ